MNIKRTLILIIFVSSSLLADKYCFYDTEHKTSLIVDIDILFDSLRICLDQDELVKSKDSTVTKSKILPGFHTVDVYADMQLYSKNLLFKTNSYSVFTLTVDEYIPPPPPPPPVCKVEEDEEIDVDYYSEPPRVIGGLEAIAAHLSYPELAFKNKTEGEVLLEFMVNTKGEAVDIIVIKETPQGMDFGKASINALRLVRFKPASSRYLGESYMQLPIEFKLKK